MRTDEGICPYFVVSHQPILTSPRRHIPSSGGAWGGILSCHWSSFFFTPLSFQIGARGEAFLAGLSTDTSTAFAASRILFLGVKTIFGFFSVAAVTSFWLSIIFGGKSPSRGIQFYHTSQATRSAYPIKTKCLVKSGKVTMFVCYYVSKSYVPLSHTKAPPR